MKHGSWLVDAMPGDKEEITEDVTFTPIVLEPSPATVTTAPEAKTLTYNGSAQELVSAGEATGGEMQYALGTATEATQPYTTSIPAATDAGTYYVWYKAVGDESHVDSEPACVKVIIKEKPQPGPTPKPTPTPAPVNTWTGYVIGTDGTLAINSKPASGNMIGKIPEGKSVTVYPDKTSGKWYYVKYGTTSGYSHSNYITKTKPATKSGVVKGTDGSLNIRAGASTSSTIRGTVKEGKTVTVFTGRTSGSWYWIYYNGIAGYASKNYIK